MNNRLLIFHSTIAPYRIDFFNDLSKVFNARVCLQYKGLLSQKFDYDKIAAKFQFTPVYLEELFRWKGRVFNYGYWKQLNDFNPDLVVVSEFGLNCILTLLHKWLKRKKYKVVSICDDSYNMVAENNDFSHLHRTLRQWVVPHLDELILVEPKVTEWYQRKFKRGFFFPIIKEDEAARDTYRNLLPMSRRTAEDQGLAGKFVFLFVGRLVALKNVETLIKAFVALQKNNAVLVIVGDGPEKENLMCLALKNDVDIRFTGRLEGDALWQWYNIANCFVLVSYQEPFGAVTNEALLAGCKGLISNKAGSQCLIENGKNGYTFQPRNVDELVEKMKLVMSENSENSNYERLRESQMTIKYNQRMTELIETLNRLCK